MSSSMHIAYLVFSFLCTVINIVPTVSHLIQGHSGPASFGIWVVLVNLNNFINSILWAKDAVDRAPVFCDLSTKLSLVGPLGLLISNLCIVRYLASVVTPGKGLESRQNARRRMMIDYLMSFGLTGLIAGASLIFQAARYQVFNLVGCSSVLVLSWPAIIIFVMWPPILCGLSCGYSLYVLYWLIRQHTKLRRLVAKSSVPLSLSRFLRMCALAATYLCISAPYTIVGTITQIHDIGPYVPWNSWSTIHNEDNELSYVRQNPLYRLHIRDWLAITAGLTVFFFFSFANESLVLYTKLFCYLRMDRVASRCESRLKSLLSKLNQVKSVQQSNSTFLPNANSQLATDGFARAPSFTGYRAFDLNVSNFESRDGVHLSIIKEQTTTNV